MEGTQNTPSDNQEVAPDLRPAFYPDSLKEIAQNAKVVLNFQHKVHQTKDRLRGAYCAFSLPQGINSPWNNWEPPRIRLLRRKSDEIWELKWGELRDWICELVLCDASTGELIDAGREERVEGFMHYRERESETTGNAVMLGMAWRESDMEEYVRKHPGMERGRAYLPRFHAVYYGRRVVEVEEGRRPGFMVYGEPFEVVGDDEAVAGGDEKYEFRDQDEEDWWWRINRDDVRKEITVHPDHPAKDKDKRPSTASVCSEQAPRRRIRTRYLRGRKPYYEDILANLNARAGDESSSSSSCSSSEPSSVSVVSDEPNYVGMLDSGILPELFSSDSDDGGGEETAVPVEQAHFQKDRPYAVAVGTSTSSESEMEDGSRLVFYAEWRLDHLTALNSHTRSR